MISIVSIVWQMSEVVSGDATGKQVTHPLPTPPSPLWKPSLFLATPSLSLLPALANRIQQEGNVTPIHYDEQENFFCQV